ncbi:hypothetical protein BAUCODRAFT_210402 [Baudoinia panamericana UAMH 10762]|uniref:Uncharacterized protein n=1 Tax=Baudoinia panamericana (strain UAMH 10762) TaxID=717646 RepID=M2N4U4_BAUPA|nr:uncharacterized protein BAUCODRAFT_210402 [Baudoinia panamericana UAMH 10762]EMC93780.1 hypothetical protein BAUCODRAFT_210402 [Baudoinia panamericana UAMH 10762]
MSSVMFSPNMLVNNDAVHAGTEHEMVVGKLAKVSDNVHHYYLRQVLQSWLIGQWQWNFMFYGMAPMTLLIDENGVSVATTLGPRQAACLRQQSSSISTSRRLMRLCLRFLPQLEHECR